MYVLLLLHSSLIIMMLMIIIITIETITICNVPMCDVDTIGCVSWYSFNYIASFVVHFILIATIKYIII